MRLFHEHHNLLNAKKPFKYVAHFLACICHCANFPDDGAVVQLASEDQLAAVRAILKEDGTSKALELLTLMEQLEQAVQQQSVDRATDLCRHIDGMLMQLPSKTFESLLSQS